MIFINAQSKETIFSSIYNYLLDHHETHGLGSLFADRLVRAIPNPQIRDALEHTYTKFIKVWPEYDLGKEVGKIDSIAMFSDQQEQKEYWIATEVKIVDSSSQNITDAGPQLIRYLNSIQEKSSATVDYIFLFLVPSDQSNISIEKFKELLNLPQITEKDNHTKGKLFLAFWKERDTAASKNLLAGIPEQNILHKSIEGMCREILDDEAGGFINPISTEMKYILKSLIGIIRHDFNRRSTLGEHGKFLTRPEFMIRLPKNHQLLYEYLEELNRAKRPISSNHTAIGFPYTEDPRQEDNNTLFRVLTMKRYKSVAGDLVDEDYVDGLIIELVHEIYFNVDTYTRIEDIFDGYANVSNDKTHPDAGGKQKAIWIELNQGIKDSDVEEVKLTLSRFVSFLKEEFKKHLE